MSIDVYNAHTGSHVNPDRRSKAEHEHEDFCESLMAIPIKPRWSFDPTTGKVKGRCRWTFDVVNDPTPAGNLSAQTQRDFSQFALHRLSFKLWPLGKPTITAPNHRELLQNEAQQLLQEALQHLRTTLSGPCSLERLNAAKAFAQHWGTLQPPACGPINSATNFP